MLSFYFEEVYLEMGKEATATFIGHKECYGVQAEDCLLYTSPESNAQNGVVIEAFLESAKRFVRGGYDVYVDGIVGPWFRAVAGGSTQRI